MPRYPKNFKDVEFFVPGRKKRVAGSTKATSDFLVMVHEMYPALTIRQLRAIITDRTKFNYQPEAVEILDAHIKAGFGDYVPYWK